METDHSPSARPRSRLRSWFPLWTATRWGTWATAAVCMLVAVVFGLQVFFEDLHIWPLFALLSLMNLLTSLRHMAGALRWADRPAVARPRRAADDAGLEIFRG